MLKSVLKTDRFGSWSEANTLMKQLEEKGLEHAYCCESEVSHCVYWAELESEWIPASEVSQKADHVADVTVIDPETTAPVEISIYKDRDSAGMFGVDGSYLLTLSDDDPVSSPFNGEDIELIEEVEG